MMRMIYDDKLKTFKSLKESQEKKEQEIPIQNVIER